MWFCRNRFILVVLNHPDTRNNIKLQINTLCLERTVCGLSCLLRSTTNVVTVLTV